MKNILKLMSVVFIFSFLVIKPLYGQSTSLYSWDRWLDNAYQLTWHDRIEIEKWLSENEKSTFKEELSFFSDKWKTQISNAEKKPDTISYPEDAYRRLAIAEMLLYLRTSDLTRLDSAFQVMNHSILYNKLELPEVAFWYFYTHAHINLEQGNSKAFVQDIYRIWFDVILKLESAQYELGSSAPSKTLRGFYLSLPFLYKNLANIILSRAIVQKHLPDIDALGPIIWSLVHRMPKKGYGKWVDVVSKRIYGPDSDNFRLSFIVLLMEGDKHFDIAQDRIDSKASIELTEQSVTKAIDYFKLTYNMAKTRHGQATSLNRHMRLVSFVLSRFDEIDTQDSRIRLAKSIQFQDGLVLHEDEDALLKAIRIFDKLGIETVRNGDWENQGFLDEETYITATNSLWRAIMNLSLDIAMHYEKNLDPLSSQSFFYNFPIIKNVLAQYLDFFNRYAKEGSLDIMPDNAYFTTVEAYEILSDLYFIAGRWEKDMSSYNLAFNLGFQAIEIFPFNMKAYYKLTQQLANLGRLDLYKKNAFHLIERIRISNTIEAASNETSKYMGETLHILQELTPQVIEVAPSNIILQGGFTSFPKESSQRLKQIIDELETDSNKIPVDDLNTEDIKRFLDRLERLEESTTPLFAKEDLPETLNEFDRINATIEEIIDRIPEEVDTEEDRERGLYPNPIVYLGRELKQIVKEAKILSQLPDMDNIREVLLLDVDNPYHKFLRRFFHENPAKTILEEKQTENESMMRRLDPSQELDDKALAKEYIEE